MRIDAQRNRRAILDAAREVFAEQGLDVPIDRIAARAKVGTGTLYRHFSSKEAMFAAILAESVDGVVELATASGPDGGEGFFSLLAMMVDEGASNRGFKEALTISGDFNRPLAESTARIRGALETSLARAQKAGVVRHDVDGSQVVALVAGAFYAIERMPSGAESRRIALDVLRSGLMAR